MFNGRGFHSGGIKIKPKNCHTCYNHFTPKSGAHKFCCESCKGKWQYISGKLSTESQYKLISGNIERYASRLLYYSGRKRDQLTREIIIDLYNKQQGLCALTGIQMTTDLVKGIKSFTNVSIDRIIAGGPYTKDNIQLVCKGINSFRGNMPIDQFVGWCRLVVEKNDGEKENL